MYRCQKQPFGSKGLKVGQILCHGLDPNKLRIAISHLKAQDHNTKIMSGKHDDSPSSTPPTTHTEHLDIMPKDYRATSVPGLPPHQEHGVAIDHKIPQDDVIQAQPDLLWSRIRRYLREPFAEFWGVFILIMFGDGVVAQVVLSNGERGDYQSISWGWGLGVMLGVYTAGISGAHLNPGKQFLPVHHTILSSRPPLTQSQPSHSPTACSASSPGASSFHTHVHRYSELSAPQESSTPITNPQSTSTKVDEHFALSQATQRPRQRASFAPIQVRSHVASRMNKI